MSEEEGYGGRRRLVAIFGDQAVGFITNTILKIMEASEKSYGRALTMAEIFLALNPPPIKEYVRKRIEEARGEAEEAYRKVVEEYRVDVERGVVDRHQVYQAAREEYARVILLALADAVGDAYYRFNTLFKKYSEEVV